MASFLDRVTRGMTDLGRLPAVQGAQMLEHGWSRTPLLNQLDPVAYLRGLPAGIQGATAGGLTGRPTTQPSDAGGGRATSMPPDASGYKGPAPANNLQPAGVKADHLTPWSTDVQYAVVSKLSNQEFNAPFQGSKNSQEITNKATGLVLSKLEDSGITLDDNVKQAFQQGADQAIRAWYQQQVAAGDQPQVTDYYLFLTNLALSVQNQVNAAKVAQPSAAATTQQSTSLQPQTTTGESLNVASGSTAAPETKDKNKISPSDDMMTWGGSVWGPDKGNYYGSQAVYTAYRTWVMQQMAAPNADKTDKSPEAFLAAMNAGGGS